MARLGDLCRFINGDRGKNYPSQAEISSDGDVPFINAGHLVDGKLDFSDMNYISEKKYNQLNSGKIQENDVLYCLRGSLGKKAIIKGISKGAIASSLVIIRPEARLINSDYLFYALESPTVQEQMMQANNGSSQPNLSAKSVSDYTFNLPTINKQCEIVLKLAKVNDLISLRKEQLTKLDQLVKARFIELFGAPETNPYGWKQTTVGEVCASIVRGPFGSALKKEFFVEPNETTYKVYEQKHAIQKSATIGTYYITAEKFDELRRFECVAGDILMSCSGTMGELYQLPEGCEKGLINQALCKFTLNKKILPIVFLTYMKQTIGKLETKGSGIQNIAAVSYVKAMPINLAPMELQEQFATFVEQTDKSKLAIQQSLDKLELLKKSLMQEYFG